MKTLRLIGMAFIAVLMCVKFTSCSNDGNEIPKKGKEVVVSLGFGGDFVTSESPLSRATSEDLYYIQVGQGDNKSFYAYGLFDSSTDIKIKLTENESYYFFAFVMKGAKEVLKHSSYVYQDAPFRFDIKLNNKFIYSNDESFTATGESFGIINPNFTYADGNFYYFAKDIDLYLQQNSESFTATENAKVTLNLMRYSYGVNFIAEDLTEGSLKISMQKEINSPNQTLISPTIVLTESSTSSDNIYGILPAFATETNEDNEFIVNMPISFTWVKADNSEILLGTPTITLKRNKKVTVKIKVDNSVENGIELAYIDNLTMGDGGTYSVEGDIATEVTE